MKTFTNCAEKKAKQFLNLLQGYTKGIRMTAILVLLLMGVSNVWSGNNIAFQSGAFFYFDPYYSTTQTIDKGYIQLAARKYQNSGQDDYGWYTAVTTLTKIANTRLYYTSTFEGPAWTDSGLAFHGWAMISNSTAKGNGSTEYWTGSNSTWYSEFKNYGLNKNSTYLFVATSASNGQSIQPNGTGYLSGGYSALNSTQTIKTAVNGADANSKATITVTSYNLTGNGAISAQQSASISTGAKSTTISAARTATTTLTVGSVATGYQFDGWYTAATGGTKLSASTTYTYYPTSATTVYARFSAKNYTITYNTNDGNSIAQKTYTIETATFVLPTPTRTGYTFAGWYDNANLTGNKVTQVAKGSTGDKTFYAAWTINQYTLTYSAGEGGTVSGSHSSGTKIDYNTSITLTAAPAEGYVLSQWVDGSGNFVSFANPYTFKLTKNTTLKAEFVKSTAVYLKPLDFWPADNARFAIYIWGDGKEDRWVEMQPVDCEKQYYSAYLPSGYSNFKYVRLNPTGKGNASKNDGLHWDYKWNETGNLTVQKDLLYITPRIYIKPNANWKQADARFAAYFYEDEKEEKWMSMYKEGDYYYCNAVDGYSNVIFCRMNPSSETNNWENCWNKSADQTIAGNCFTVTAGEWGDNPNDQNYNEAGAKGTWSEHYTIFSTPTYNVTIKPTIHGTYSVVCNGRTYLVPDKEEIVIPNVPVGTTLTIQDVKPNNETEYTSDIIYKESANAEYQTLEGNQITVCGNTTIDENFVTRNPHVVYFRVPTSLATSWNANGTTNFVYSYNDIKKGETGYVTTMVADNSIQDAQYTYYHCTIPAGCHTFRFERKNNTNESALQSTVSFTHAMPFNGMNCFTITNKSGDEYTGYWDVLLTNGDYRLLYVEQVVEKSNASGNEWKTVVTRKKAHPSDIIKKGVESQIVSLHIYKERKYQAVKKYNGSTPEFYESSNNPEIILQQYSNGVWVDKESHMVFGPLETLPGMAMAPGRRNAAADGELVYDDGIEIIKNDQHPDESNGVWNFTVTQSNGGESATIDLTQTRRYNEETDGPYYIRTDVANGNWYDYTNPDNHMTRSDVSKQHSNYSHYFCKWVESTGNVNVKFTIANKYGYAISDTLEADRTDLWGVELTEAQKMLKNQTLPENANVRFTWNEKSNLIHRAYIAGSANVQDRFLVLRGKGDSKLFNAEGNALAEGQEQTPRYGLHANEEIFSDIENWVYKTDVQMIPGAELQVTADYNEKVQYFVGKEGIFNNTILQGSSDEKYLVRLLYDFKTNELISAYVPGGEVENIQNISTNLMIIRQNYSEAKQLVFNGGDMSTRENRKAYGVIEFTEDYLTNEKIPYLKRCLYWVSFPFDVNLSEAFGSLVYGKHWLIQEYDGARRAAEGLWKESESFWKLHWEPNNITLKAGLGYVIEIDINQMIKDNIIDTKDAKQQIAALYFPSNTPITREIINQASYTVNIPAHKCEIVHTGTYGDRTIRDSHWNVIGVPSYINTGATFSDQRYALNNVVKYYYQWDGEKDAYTPKDATNKAYDFHSMYAYMVQYAGDITWNSVLLDEKPAQIAAKKNSVTNEHAMRLELQQNNILLDKTFVRLQDDVATHAFDFNYDLCKITNKGANIYSIITAEASPVDVAANVLPIEETIIPIGIKTDASGDYTFAMPDGTDGITVELIDYETNTRTNMLLSDYTVSLPKGTNETRFALHVKPNKVVTGTENIHTSSDRQIKKYIIDGALYLIKDGTIYDAQGRCVK